MLISLIIPPSEKVSRPFSFPERERRQTGFTFRPNVDAFYFGICRAELPVELRILLPQASEVLQKTFDDTGPNDDLCCQIRYVC